MNTPLIIKRLLVRKNMIAIMLLFISIDHDLSAQNWLPEFRVRITHQPISQINDHLYKFLARDFRTNVKGCETRMNIFYFRVNYKGKVDSIYWEGNFSEKQTELILRNIKSTNENWKLPSNTTASSSCWFVYPCFIFGTLEDECASDPANQRLLSILYNLLSFKALSFDQRGRYHLHPTRDLTMPIK